MKEIKKLLGIAGLVLVWTMVVVGLASAKGEPTSASITGPGLSRRIEIRDSEVLAILNPWIGGFADWRDGLVNAPPHMDSTYRVSVFMSADGKSKAPEPIYVFYYDPNFEGEWGLVYVPGTGEDWYSTNVATIIAGREGEWHPASEALDAALRPLIENHLGQAQSGWSEVVSKPTTLISLVLVIALLMTAAIVGRRAIPESPSAFSARSPDE